MNLLTKIKEHKKTLIILAVLLLIAGIAHGYNMFHFPYYENDEGTYMSQAWSLLTQGKLAPYTYWYDHTPAGWMLIALWVKLTGGFFTFGASVNSGRVLMLVLHLFSAAFLFYIAKKLSKGYLAGILAVIIFSLSPLGIYFQRRVLLDNIMIFWVLLSLAILFKDKLKLRYIIISAVSFGIAVLTKENAIFFTPAFIYVLYSKTSLHHRSFAVVKWLAVSGLIISIYFLYALQKGEFFPAGFFGSSPHVSLFTTLQEQIARGGGFPFWDQRSDFFLNLKEWVSRDAFTTVVGAVATLVSIILSIRARSLRIPAFFAILFWVFLIRGKLVIDFYIVPLIPLLALNLGMLIDFIAKKITFNKRLAYYFLMLPLTIAIAVFLLRNPIGQYTRDETTPQVETINWIQNNLPEKSNIVIDNSFFVDLHEKRFAGDKIFPNADWFWKLSYDPQIRDVKYENDWKKIDYITLSHEMLKQINVGTQDFLKKPFNNSSLVIDWKQNSTSYIDLKNYISTNGDWMAIYKVKSKEKIILDSSWNSYKVNFIKSYGQIIDPTSNDKTTSEGQAYAMLRAVWQNDKNTFKSVFTWTKDHLQNRTQDKLFSWLWEKDGADYKIGDSASASDADEDIALALLFANKQWGDEKRLTAAKEIINDIWEKEVVSINGHYYLTSGTGAGREDGYLVNPSYLFPAAYRIFSQVDTKHPWAKLADDSYFLLNNLGSQKDNSSYLPTNWILIDKKTGEIKSPAKYIADPDASTYGFDAFRTMWRTSLDVNWFNSQQAKSYLEKVKPFFVEQWRKDDKFAAIYNLDGTKRVPYNSLSTDSGGLSVFSVTDKILAKDSYSKLFESKFKYDFGYWGDKNNYYDQNWSWFGTALYTNNLSNIWNTD